MMISFETEIIFRLVLAALLGGAIGLEREIHGREAGLRTYFLVSLGTALMMVVSDYLLFNLDLDPLKGFLRADPGRIAAQAITGIGFLGAGTIIRYKDSIRGLTTAACIWVTCAIGLSIGSGYYLFGSITTGITIIALVGFKSFERRLPRDWYRGIAVVSEDLEGQTERIRASIERHQGRVTRFIFSKDLGKKEIMVDFRLQLRSLQSDEKILQEVMAMQGIKRVEWK
jgi:putative Mg2+ transporter-C (MgtC) family protein